MKIRERALAILLSMVMMLTFMPALAFANDEVFPPDLEQGGIWYEATDANTCDAYIEDAVGEVTIPASVTFSDGRARTVTYVCDFNGKATAAHIPATVSDMWGVGWSDWDWDENDQLVWTVKPGFVIFGTNGTYAQIYANKYPADNAGRKQKQRQIHSQNRRGRAHGVTRDAPVKDRHVPLPAEDRKHGEDHHRHRGRLHAAGRRARRAADEHQDDHQQFVVLLQLREIRRVKPGRPGRHGLKETGQKCLRQRQVPVLCQREPDAGQHDQDTGGDQHDLRLQGKTAEAETGIRNIFPDIETETADDDQRHDGDVDDRVCLIGR